MPDPLGKFASTEAPAPRKRIPRNANDSSGSNRIPSRYTAPNESGIKPSPQALSMGGSPPSTTVTSKPLRRAAIAAASPAGPPPTTTTSVLSGTPVKLPPQQNQFGTKSGAHGRQNTVRSRGRATFHHHFFQHQQHRCRRQIARPAQAIPRCG